MIRKLRQAPSGPEISVLAPSTADPPDPAKYLSETGEYTIPGSSPPTPTYLPYAQLVATGVNVVSNQIEWAFDINNEDFSLEDLVRLAIPSDGDYEFNLTYESVNPATLAVQIVQVPPGGGVPLGQVGLSAGCNLLAGNSGLTFGTNAFYSCTNEMRFAVAVTDIATFSAAILTIKKLQYAV